MNTNISVVVPVYKVENYICECVDSILNQTYKNIEVILVDDGSPDNCPKICDEYAQIDNRVSVIHKQNGGLSDARNFGLEKASGDYVVFIDSDDYWKDNNVLQTIVERLNVTNADILNFGFVKFYENDGKYVSSLSNKKSMPLENKSKSEQLKYLMENDLYISSAWSKVVRRELLDDGMLFRLNVLSEDIDWSARLMLKAKSFDFIVNDFYVYRQRSNSITHTMKAKACLDLESAILNSFKVLDESDDESKEGLKHYIAYQFSTFVVVQSIAESCPKECIENLSKYSWILKYSNNKKVKTLYRMNKVFGFERLCKYVKLTKTIWKRR